MTTPKLSPDELAARLSTGGREGGLLSAALRRRRRERYEAGEMTTSERRKYEALLAKLRESGSKGGQVIARRFAEARAAKAAQANGTGDDEGML